VNNEIEEGRNVIVADKMIDGHIHIERGPYTLEWIQRFVDRAVETGLDEIRLLEHNFRFNEFIPMYDSVRAYSEYVDAWFQRQIKDIRLEEYLELIALVRRQHYPIDIRFGLEVCYFPEQEDFIAGLVKNKGFDFLLGSVHFVDDFAFDHKAEHWEGQDVDRIYERYFEESVALAESGLFDGIGHPDSIKLFGHRPSYALNRHYEALAEALAKHGLYADQNSGVYRRCPGTSRPGMEPELLRALKKRGVTIITSSDAHCPEDVGYLIPELSRLALEA